MSLPWPSDGGGNLYVGGHFTAAGGAAAPHRPLDRGGWPGHPRPGAYTFYTNNLPVTIVVPPGGQGDLARIILQRFDKSHTNASPALETGYYWQIEGLNAGGRMASGYSVDLTLSAPGFTPDGNDQVCHYTGSGRWDCAVTSYTANTITRNGVTQLSDWAVRKDVTAPAQTPTPTPTASANTNTHRDRNTVDHAHADTHLDPHSRRRRHQRHGLARRERRRRRGTRMSRACPA